MDRNSDIYKLTLTGNGQASVEPDVAIIQVGVETTGDNLTNVQSENAEKAQSMLQSLKQLDISVLETIQYEINKAFDYENGRQIDKGYRVRNIFEVRTNNINQVGLLIDTAVANGANVVNQISFAVSNPEKYYLEALNLAVMDAYEKAKSITENLGLNVEPMAKHIQEQSTNVIPLRNIAIREGASSTPIEPGRTQIEANVIVEYIY